MDKKVKKKPYFGVKVKVDLMIKMNMPDHVNQIIRKLNEQGFEAFAVGGCVRDSILLKTPQDWDITTSAVPEQVKQIFHKTIDTGLKHGTVTVLIDREPYEVTTYRIDGLYENHRHPQAVSFTGDLIEDLRRRDFTMNAMAYNEKEGLVDVFSGMKALQERRIECVGDPNERFVEDALRMLRAIRFAAQLGFDIHPETEAAISTNAHLIQNISGERIHMEMTKILVSEHPHYIQKMVTLGLMQYIIPEFMINVGLEQQNMHHIYPVDEHIYEAVRNVKATETLRWTLFFHDIGKGYCKTVDDRGVGHFFGHPEKSNEIARKVLTRLKFDNKTANDILKLILFHDHRIEDTMKSVRKAVGLIGNELFLSYTQVQEADIKAQNPVYNTLYLSKLQNIVLCYEELIAQGQCTTLKDLAVNGGDLMTIGVVQGKCIGLILNALLEQVLEEPERNNKLWLIKKAEELMKIYQ